MNSKGFVWIFEWIFFAVLVFCSIRSSGGELYARGLALTAFVRLNSLDQLSFFLVIISCLRNEQKRTLIERFSPHKLLLVERNIKGDFFFIYEKENNCWSTKNSSNSPQSLRYSDYGIRLRIPMKHNGKICACAINHIRIISHFLWNPRLFIQLKRIFQTIIM